MNGHIDDILHEPLRVRCVLVPWGRLDIGELRGTTVSVDACLKQVLAEQHLVWCHNREEPNNNINEISE